MGVIACVECGGEVNEAAARCPACGADPRTGYTEEERAAAESCRPLDPVEQARSARERGQRFLEIALPFVEDEVTAMRAGRRDRSAKAAAGSRAAQLSAVEAEGWQLIASDYITGGMIYRRDPVAFIEAGSVEPVTVTGIYLFRAVDDLESDVAAD
jgi:hypothetical protein